MKNTLRLKITISFLLLSAILLSSGGIIYYETYSLERSVRVVVYDNYKTIAATRSMLKALEDENKGILMLMVGNQTEGSEAIRRADSVFVIAMNDAQFSLSEPGEDKYLESIKESYAVLKDLYSAPIVNTDKQGNINWYIDILSPSYLEVVENVKSLGQLNQECMYNEATDLRNSMHRSLMPGLVAIGVALVFSMLLNFFINIYYVVPLQKLSDTIKRFKYGDRVFYANLFSSDEIKKLESEIRLLIDRVANCRDSSKETL